MDYEVYETILRLLAASGLPYKVHEHPTSRTVADAQAYLSFPVERLLKTIAFKSKAGKYILAAVRGLDRIDYRRLALAAGTRRTEIMRLTPEEVVHTFGVEVGSVSPILLRDGVEILFDAGVPTAQTVFCGIARPDRTLEMHLLDLVQITRGRVLPLRSDPSVQND